MIRLRLLCFVVAFILTKAAYSQNKAFVLQNAWYTDLNNYNPRPFLDDVLIALEDKLAVKKIIDETQGPEAVRLDSTWEKKFKDLIERRKTAGDNAYYIAISSELRLPIINLGKILFKNPPRTSKFIFTFHVYNTAGKEILGDTIVNRGCISRTIDLEKGNKSFYADYKNFLDDMHCHLQFIKQQLQVKSLPAKLYRETK